MQTFVYSNTIHNNQKGKQPKFPLTDEWIKEDMLHKYTMGCFSAIGKHKVMPLGGNMNLEIIILSISDKSEEKRQIPCDITYMWNLNYQHGM